MRIGEALISEGLIKTDQLSKAIGEQQKSRERLGEIIIKMGFVQSAQMARFIADHFNLPFVDLKSVYKIIDPAVIRLIPEETSRRFKVIPISISKDILTIAMVDPVNVVAEDTVRIKTGLKIKRMVAFENDLLEAIEYCYHQMPQLKEHIDQFMVKEAPQITPKDSVDDLRVEASDPPVVKYVHQLVVQAVNSQASDIHIIPKQDRVDLRIRIDSILYDCDPPPKGMFLAIVTRIKILADLDIAERRLPQDGRFNMQVAGLNFDIRVSCFPTIFGESIVLRLLNTSTTLMGLDQLGMSIENLIQYRRFIHRPYGLILVTGPTGSGKTTTLYTTLNEIKSPQKNIVTIEDPVEYRLPFLQQSQVHPAIGFDFARGLRSLLRQDPDIIMVGEIRDRETAEIAIHASLTGHLVFSTLHTNDAVSAGVRLTNMGVEPYLLASSLIGVLAQRLVRKICPTCKVQQIVPPEVWQGIGLPANAFNIYHGQGCEDCLKRGYKGRTAIFEVLSVNEKIRDLISARASSDTIRREAQQSGLKTLAQSGMAKLKEGVTTIDDVLRVTRESEDN